MKLKYVFSREAYGLTDDPAQTLGPEWQKRLFEGILNAVATSVYPRGLAGVQSRALNRILLALDSTGQDSIEIDKADLEFLRSMFTNESAAVPPQQVRGKCRIEDEIESTLSFVNGAKLVDEVRTTNP